MPADLPYEVSRDPATRTVRLAVSGEIDIAVIDDLREGAEEAVAERPDTVIVDFAEVTFMDSTGIRFLVGLKTRCDAVGASWRLEHVSTSVHRLIELSGLNDFLHPTI